MNEDDRWQFEKVGMGYRCWSDEIQTEFRLTHIKRSRGDLTGELAVKANIKDVKTHKGVLHVARFNVLSSASRNALAKMLGGRTPGLDMDWYDGLEWLCQNVILAETQGEAIDEVGLKPPTPPSQQWMVEPLVLKGRPSMIFGPGGVGKSLLGLTCGLSVAAGREIIPGIAPAVKGPVLYLDWETTADVINDRIQSVAAGHGFKPAGMFYRRCVRPLADDAEELSVVVAEKKIVLVVVDSAAYAMGAQGEYGDANEAVLRMHEALRIIGATSLIIDHVNKTDQKSRPGKATPYGSAYKTNAVRISWEVRKAPSPNGLAINLYHAKSNDTRQLDPIGLALEWDENMIRFTKNEVVEDETEYRNQTEGGGARQAILELLEDGAGMTSGSICATLHQPAATVRSNLKRMVERGELTLDGRGLYRIAVAPTHQPIRLSSVPGGRGFDQ
jgi:hypothetical protein